MTVTLLQPSARLPGRPREFDMEPALDRALGVFSERGYHAASISELTEAMGLTSGSVYKAFRDKRGIFLAALEHYRILRRSLLEQELGKTATGWGKLAALMRFYADASHGIQGRRGCMVVTSANSLALLDEEVAREVAAIFDANEQLLADLIRLGQKDGSIPRTVDVGAVASTLLCLVNGMRLVGKIGRSHKEMMTVADVAMELLR